MLDGETELTSSATPSDQHPTGAHSSVKGPLSQPHGKNRSTDKTQHAYSGRTALHSVGAQRILITAEAVVIIMTSLVTGLSYHGFIFGIVGNYSMYLAMGVLAAAVYSAAMSSIDSHQTLRSLDSTEALRDVTLVWSGTIAAITFFAFTLKTAESMSRGAVFSLVITGYAALLATRIALPTLIARYYNPRKLVSHQVIVVGSDEDPSLSLILRELETAGYSAPQIIRLRSTCPSEEWGAEFQRTIKAVLSLSRTVDDGEICVAAGGFPEQRLRELIVALQIVPRSICIVPSPSIEQFLHFPIRDIGVMRAVELQRTPLSPIQLLIKRTLDLALASIALLLMMPLLLLTAVAIRVDTRGPVLFRQSRLGHRGVPFSIIKFRTMTVTEDGENIQQAHKNDKRVTRVGRRLRRLSIDELPQLLNVIKGEMALVGPRPHAVAHDKYYTRLINNYEIRQHVKPGITGWAQVNGLRGETTSPELMRKRVEHDIWYAKNASITLDIKILLLTVVEVFRQRNAH